MPTTSKEDLDKIISDLDDAITSSHQPFSNDSHRKTVDLQRALRLVAKLEKELQADTGANIHGQVISYFNKAAIE